MTANDLPQINRVADVVHVNYPEDEAVFAERLRLYPSGCFVLAAHGRCVGYIISHPSTYARPPPLNSLLGSIPEPATTYYIHDIALLPEARKRGYANEIVGRLIDHAARSGLRNVSLIAVNNSTAFWERHGFALRAEPSVERKLQSYGEGSYFMVRDLP